MPNPLAFISNYFFNRVRNSAEQYNGHCTWRFSQGNNPIANIIETDSETAGGICEMLSVRWIERHASGSSLASWLSASGGSIDKNDIDPSKIRQLMQLYIAGTTLRSGMMAEENSGCFNQTNASIRWLREKGILQCRSINFTQVGSNKYTMVQDRRGERGDMGRKDFATEIAVSIQRDLKSCYGNYAVIGIYGNGGHAMAAWIGQDACFFDPNYGEFYFSDKNAFINWFPFFFKRAGYMSSSGLCESYHNIILSPRH
ncbi:YopT-type cysteine protease domain-containing protein [Endozoicomonas sp.]|uniref:YopT-type cysteine protease domain-containing protein n=1 Tax=Endozoicomonas sp. TaxID=1892382 RepID=UPI002886E09C|nr:YopT-type cysteine protease domain-containing protein [Endozoicomonas sp.]